jgi:hypothetical protein
MPEHRLKWSFPGAPPCIDDISRLRARPSFVSSLF